MSMSVGRRADAPKAASRRVHASHVGALSLAALLTALAVAAPASVGAAQGTAAADSPSAPTAAVACTKVITPRDSVASAMGAVRAGDVLCLRGGEYLQDVSVTPRKGTASARITMQSYPGERAVLRGLQRFTDPDFWTFRGLGFTWNRGSYDQHMVKIIGGTGWIVEKSQFWGARSFANLLIVGSSTYGPPKDWILRDSILRDTPGGEANDARSHNLYVNAPNSTGGLISRNIFANAPKGNNLKLGGSSKGTDGTDNVYVRYNTFVNGHQSNVLIGNGASNNVFYMNLMVGNDRGWAVRLYDLRGKGNLVAGNYWYDSSGGRFCSDYDSTVRCTSVIAGATGGRNPLLDSTYRPTDARADDYGRYGYPSK